MKSKLVVIGLLISQASFAQDHAIIFPKLLSPIDSVLMTNAEFRCFSGDKMFFKNEGGYHAFHAADLNTNVLFALHVSSEQLEAKQKAADEADKRYRIAMNSALSELLPRPEPDDYFLSIQRQLEASSEPNKTADEINQSIDDFFGEKITVAAIKGQSDATINRIEMMRDQAKLRVINIALEIAKKEASKDRQIQLTAESNLSAFISNPDAYISNNPSIIRK